MADLPVPTVSQMDAEVFQFSNVVFAMIKDELKDSPVLTSMHWMMIQRATVHYAKACIKDATASDKAMSDLLSEPLRALRSSDALTAKLYGDVAKIISEIVPVEYQQAVRDRLIYQPGDDQP